MVEITNGKKFAFLSAVCFAIVFLTDIVSSFDFVRDHSVLIVTAVILAWISYIGLAAAAFLRNKKAVAAAAGVHLTALLFYFLTNTDQDYFDWIRVFQLLSYIALIVTTVYSGKEKHETGRIWFFAAAFFFISILSWAGQFTLSALPSVFREWQWFDYLYVVSELTALLFAGLWLKTDFSPFGVPAA